MDRNVLRQKLVTAVALANSRRIEPLLVPNLDAHFQPQEQPDVKPGPSVPVTNREQPLPIPNWDSMFQL